MEKEIYETIKWVRNYYALWFHFCYKFWKDTQQNIIYNYLKVEKFG